ncbi:HTH-type transcriptional repressor PurR [Novipirellula aureliae]|uniref:HTH-type transcriptional repressor PurR n=1 Tax=Novipirellula aureliae TaxID=2527966 RepID=A0A5C6DI08_9BACT|nr:LacI family DNA-binding transcriptional regulator [Novipirellula aureliae]TWU36470.1 HTH-type transcriptional repressor PurR [Novipirellula aureliae]
MSIVKVAELAGVSHTTVSRVINSEGSVRSETADRIRAIMEDIGYVPKPPSRRRGPRRLNDTSFKTGNIAFLTSSESLKVLTRSPIMANVLQGIEEALASHGMSMVHGAVGSKRPLPPIVAKGGVDGVIVWPHLDAVSPEAMEVLRRYKVVYVMSGISERLTADRVRVNHGKVGRLAVSYLASKGCKTLAYVTPSSLISRVNLCDRWAAFSSLAEEQGLSARQCEIEQSQLDLLEIDRDRDLLIQKTLKAFLAQGQRPTGMFVTCDALTAKLYPILKSLGIQIGRDLEILSCNNETSLLAGLEPRPISIDIQPEEIGRKAVAQLRWRIQHPEEESQVTIEVPPKFLE